MTFGNLKHLRLFKSVSDLGSLTKAAEQAGISQPAATQALAKLERTANGPLLERGRGGHTLTGRGKVLLARTERALAFLDPALDEIAPRLKDRTTFAQLRALVAVVNIGNFTLGAKSLGLAQPTVHRAVGQLEQDGGRELFVRTPHGLIATRMCRALSSAATVTFAEIEQAEAEIAEMNGDAPHPILLGSLPGPIAVVVTKALAQFRQMHTNQPVTLVQDGLCSLLNKTRAGQLHFVLSSLGERLTDPELGQEPLYSDSAAFVVPSSHPMAGAKSVSVKDVAQESWVVSPKGTMSRRDFDNMFEQRGGTAPQTLVETEAAVVVQQLVSGGGMLGCLTQSQLPWVLTNPNIKELKVDHGFETFPVGVVTRPQWQPTPAQADLLNCLREAARAV